MTGFDDTLLDDPVRLAEADTEARLRAAAMAGAQVRASAEIAREQDLARHLDVDRPRALVLAGGQGTGRAAMRVIASLLAPGCPVPVVVTDVVPNWVGALDVVYAFTADPGDDELAVSLDRAVRYGATVVLTAPPEGPVAAAVAGRGLLISPQLRGAIPESFPCALITGLLTVSGLNLLPVDVDLEADQLDAEAERNHLGHESFVNPAKSLALRWAERTPLLWGLDPVAAAVAGYGAHALAADAAVVADAAEYRHAVTRVALHRAVVNEHTGSSIFADPEEEAQDGVVPRIRLLLVAIRTDAAASVVRRSAHEVLPEAEVLDMADELGVAEPALAAVLALRMEMAALYLGLASGTVGGRYHSVQA